MDLTISNLMQMQKELQAQHPEWGGTPPAFGKQQLLYAVGEIGEVVEIMKKKGDQGILSDSVTREHAIEEMSDVFMYLTDVLLCYGVTADEFSRIYAEKHERNMKRNYADERRRLFKRA